MFTKKTIKDIDLKGKRVLLRADYNVPLDEKGVITDDYRIKQSLPTIQYLLSKQCKVIICSHLGRPDGQHNDAFSLEPVSRRLSELLKQPVQFALDCVGPVVEEAASQLKGGEIMLLENLRFHPEEEANNAAAFFLKNIKEFKQQINDLSHKSRKRVIYAIVAHPLQDENEKLITNQEEEHVVNLALALFNAKLIMVSYAQQQKVEQKSE